MRVWAVTPLIAFAFLVKATWDFGLILLTVATTAFAAFLLFPFAFALALVLFDKLLINKSLAFFVLVLAILRRLRAVVALELVA